LRGIAEGKKKNSNAMGDLWILSTAMVVFINVLLLSGVSVCVNIKGCHRAVVKNINVEMILLNGIKLIALEV
jgi:hypothetical protein